MGYTIKIGNAKPVFYKDDFPYLNAGWEVEAVNLPQAPAFPNDVNNNWNERWPSYLAWHNFTKTTGLYIFFYGKYKRDSEGNEIEFDGIFEEAGHPGCIGITKESADFVTKALNDYKRDKPPGFPRDEDHMHDCVRLNCQYECDPHLARLIWLEWWMQWAVKNCDTPAIENG